MFIYTLGDIVGTILIVLMAFVYIGIYIGIKLDEWGKK